MTQNSNHDASKQEPQPVDVEANKEGSIVLPHVHFDLYLHVGHAPYDNATEIGQDLMRRAEVGVATYGQLLRTNNGRCPLKDAYAEALDLMMYAKQGQLERPDLAEELGYVFHDAFEAASRLKHAIDTKS